MRTPGKRDTGSWRSQRADARANRGRILDVAEEVFGKGGESASTEEVARLAGVGVATVFRHFPTKAALLEAVLVRRFDRLCEQAETLLDATDPGRAFFDFFSHLVADAATKIAIAEALLEAGGDSDGDAAQASNGLRRAVAALLQHAQHAGAVRDDVELPEVYALLVATSRAAAHAHLDQEVRARVLAIVFDGLAPLPNARAQTREQPELPRPHRRAST
ncbi:MAG: TetR family transcriptional regulator [Actinophytocola sp.]|uniref:TetR/AcrR family transcriptional regulator n=1 Tax=Actinophytocola sp. TaxID=1872138 RepID=UPI00132B3BEC|nr:TetR/AcrR family transcriptional regulator [Actinophytocola sp.]MPZ83906.1 TetR family transcriptional regulator [Actinophytocola sp.]